MLEFHRKCILQYALVLCSLFVLRVVITEERLRRGAFFRKICGTTAFQLVKTQPFCRHCLKILICRACTLAISLDPKYLFVIHQKWTSFYRCSSRIQMSVCCDTSRSLIHSLSIRILLQFTGFWICLYSSLEIVIEWCLLDTWVML